MAGVEAQLEAMRKKEAEELLASGGPMLALEAARPTLALALTLALILTVTLTLTLNLTLTLTCGGPCRLLGHAEEAEALARGFGRLVGSSTLSRGKPRGHAG